MGLLGEKKKSSTQAQNANPFAYQKMPGPDEENPYLGNANPSYQDEQSSFNDKQKVANQGRIKGYFGWGG